jgi:RNA polymerase sigma-70 factor, ECF subfamily
VSTIDISSSVEEALEAHRRELTGYCYRMLGSGFEAEDAVQETMVRAWRAADTLGQREALRAWLYRIAHNVCLDMLKGSQRRARPMDLGPASTAATTLGAPLVEQTWVMPIQDSSVLPTGGDPAEMAAAKESLRLAFIAALQLLPPKQRAVLILREVLRWQATEVAELLGTTVASVNSALQRARATIDASDIDVGSAASTVSDEEERDLLGRYMEAFEEYDISKLTSLLHDDALFSMPPFDLWIVGPEEVGEFMLGTGAGCRGSRLLPVSVNGSPAFASYRPYEDGVHRPHSIVVLQVADGKIGEICNFLGEESFKLFGLPLELRAEPAAAG